MNYNDFDRIRRLGYTNQGTDTRFKFVKSNGDTITRNHDGDLEFSNEVDCEIYNEMLPYSLPSCVLSVWLYYPVGVNENVMRNLGYVKKCENIFGKNSDEAKILPSYLQFTSSFDLVSYLSEVFVHPYNIKKIVATSSSVFDLSYDENSDDTDFQVLECGMLFYNYQSLISINMIPHMYKHYIGDRS